MIMTRKGSLMPSVFFFSLGHSMKVVDTLVPMISSTELWMSASVMRLMCPFLTFLSQICRGFDLYRQLAAAEACAQPPSKGAAPAGSCGETLPDGVEDGQES